MGLKKEEREDENDSSTFSSVSITKDDTRILNPANFKPFVLMESIKTSHNTKLLRFQLPTDLSIGLPVGRHISVMAHIDGNKVMRPYTPVSRPDEKGHFDLLIKVYEYGKMSNHLWNLHVGETLEVRGPIGRFKYTPNMYSHMVFICGGTGLTPCLQVIRWILEGPSRGEEQTKLTLFYQNRTLNDILLLEMLENLEKTHRKFLRILYFLSDPSSNPKWGLHDGELENDGEYRRQERRGYIHKDSLEKEGVTSQSCDWVGLCGPSGFNEKMIETVGEIGFERGKNLHVW